MSVTEDDIFKALADFQRERRDDPDVLRDLYQRGRTPTEIAQELGIHRATVYRRLERMGLWEKKYTGHTPRKDRCQRDHDMNVWGVDIVNKGKSKKRGRYCRMCKRLRERKGGLSADS